MDFQSASKVLSQAVGRSDLQQFEQAAFHRWHNFILGFSDQVVQQIIEKLGITCQDTVLDPFCGTGTTLIECAKRGINSIGVDANPFAVFSADVKSRFCLNPDDLMRAATRVERRYQKLKSSNRRFTDDPTYHYLNESGMLDRGWISKRPLRKALALREAIWSGRDPAIADALMLALVADLPTNIGNMKFGPQIYRGSLKEDVDPLPSFRLRVKAMVADLREANGHRTYPKPVVILGDARSLKPALRQHYSDRVPGVDFVISSPPYPTEHDYTRHTRLELAFIDSVSTIGCLRRIKRTMIRSHTKGIYRDDDDERRVRRIVSIERLAEKVEKAIRGKDSGFEKLYPTVVRSYFGGMRRHFGSLFRLMKSGGKAAYVVGDQAAYLRIPIRTAVLLGETAESVGFRVLDVYPWRRRWATGISDFLEENILIVSRP